MSSVEPLKRALKKINHLLSRNDYKTFAKYQVRLIQITGQHSF